MDGWAPLSPPSVIAVCQTPARPQGPAPALYLVAPRSAVCSLSSVWQSFGDCRLLDYSHWHSISGRLRLQSRLGVRVRIPALLHCTHVVCVTSSSSSAATAPVSPPLSPAATRRVFPYLHLSLAGGSSFSSQRQHFCMQIRQTSAPPMLAVEHMFRVAPGPWPLEGLPGPAVDVSPYLLLAA